MKLTVDHWKDLEHYWNNLEHYWNNTAQLVISVQKLEQMFFENAKNLNATTYKIIIITPLQPEVSLFFFFFHAQNGLCLCLRKMSACSPY